jgi:flagellar basal body-associated protein FliL
MPLKGILFIFIVILIACWCFRGEIYAFIKGEKEQNMEQEENEEKDSEERK